MIHVTSQLGGYASAIDVNHDASVVGKRALESDDGVEKGCAVSVANVMTSSVATSEPAVAAERTHQRRRGPRTARHAVLVCIPDHNLRRFLQQADNVKDWRGAESLLFVPMTLPGQATPANYVYTLVITYPEAIERNYKRWSVLPSPMPTATRVQELQRMPGAVTVQLTDAPLETFPHPSELLATRRRLEQELQHLVKMEKAMEQITRSGLTQVGREWFEPDASGVGMCIATVESVRATLTLELELRGCHFLSKPRWAERARLLARIPFDAPQRVVCVVDSDDAQEELRELLGACRMERWNGRADSWPRALVHEFVVVDVSGEVTPGFLGDVARARALVWVDRAPNAPQAATQLAMQTVQMCKQLPLPTTTSDTTTEWAAEEFDLSCA